MHEGYSDEARHKEQQLIRAEHVTVIRDRQTLLKDVSLAVGTHDFITIIGPNGAGKSLLLKCLMGFYTPDRGTVNRREALKLGYVPQQLLPDYTLPVTAGRFLKLRKQVKRVDDAAVEKVTEEIAVQHLLEKPLHLLSGGELQRVLLSRALLHDPELLVLDEPAQNLDICGQLVFYKLLERIYNERKIGILMVSHDLHLVMSCTKKVVCLFHHICCSGTPRVVTQDPEFISLFGDDMARMMAVYHHSHDHRHGEE